MEIISSKPPLWYWIVSGLAGFWLFVGVFAWLSDPAIVPSNFEQFSDVQRELFAARPLWLFVLYGIAVFSGLIGAIGLLLRKSWATMAFWVSLVSAIVQFGFTFVVMDAIRVLGAAQALTFPLIILAIGAFLVWFSTYARKRGWIVG